MTATDDDELIAHLRSPKHIGANVRNYAAARIEALREQVAAAEAARDDALAHAAAVEQHAEVFEAAALPDGQVRIDGKVYELPAQDVAAVMRIGVRALVNLVPVEAVEPAPTEYVTGDYWPAPVADEATEPCYCTRRYVMHEPECPHHEKVIDWWSAAMAWALW